MHQDIYEPSLIAIESLDMFAGDPEYQQYSIEIEYSMDNYCVTV